MQLSAARFMPDMSGGARAAVHAAVLRPAEAGEVVNTRLINKINTGEVAITFNQGMTCSTVL
jgi:hypothetical protein